MQIGPKQSNSDQGVRSSEILQQQDFKVRLNNDQKKRLFSFLDKFQGKVSMISKDGHLGVVARAGKPIEKGNQQNSQEPVISTQITKDLYCEEQINKPQVNQVKDNNELRYKKIQKKTQSLDVKVGTKGEEGKEVHKNSKKKLNLKLQETQKNISSNNKREEVLEGNRENNKGINQKPPMYQQNQGNIQQMQVLSQTQALSQLHNGQKHQPMLRQYDSLQQLPMSNEFYQEFNNFGQYQSNPNMHQQNQDNGLNNQYQMHIQPSPYQNFGIGNQMRSFENHHPYQIMGGGLTPQQQIPQYSSFQQTQSLTQPNQFYINSQVQGRSQQFLNNLNQKVQVRGSLLTTDDKQTFQRVVPNRSQSLMQTQPIPFQKMTLIHNDVAHYYPQNQRKLDINSSRGLSTPKDGISKKAQTLTFNSIGNQILRNTDYQMISNKRLFSNSKGLGPVNVGSDDWIKAKQRNERIQNFLRTLKQQETNTKH